MLIEPYGSPTDPYYSLWLNAESKNRGDEKIWMIMNANRRDWSNTPNSPMEWTEGYKPNVYTAHRIQ